MQIPIGLPLFLWTSLASYLYNSGVLPLLSFLHVLPYNTTGSMSAAPAPPPPNKRESKFQISRFIRDSYPRPSYRYRAPREHAICICAYAHDHEIEMTRTREQSSKSGFARLQLHCKNCCAKIACSHATTSSFCGTTCCFCPPCVGPRR